MSSNYMLYIDSNLSSGHQSLEEAKQAAEPHIEEKCVLSIVIPAAPAPTKTCSYDYEVNDWVTNA